MRNFNQSPEAQRKRSERVKNRVLPPKVCETCEAEYTPKSGNQRRCDECKEAGRKLP